MWHDALYKSLWYIEGNKVQFFLDGYYIQD